MTFRTRFQHPLATVPGGIPVPQLDRFVLSGGGATGDGRPAHHPAGEDHVASTVGFPRLSRISRACTSMMVLMGGPKEGERRYWTWGKLSGDSSLDGGMLHEAAAGGARAASASWSAR